MSKTNENLINIGKAVYHLIRKIDKLNDNVYPLIVDVDVPFPFAVYRRNSISYNVNKDCTYKERITIDLVIASERYDESIQLANEAKNILENVKKTTIQDIYIKEINILDASEDYEENTFIQSLQFEIVIQ